MSMRVISGTARGTKLSTVPSEGTREILERNKIILFDLIRPQIKGTSFLDLFAGSGQVGIEALSNGAGSAVFLDLAEEAIATIRANVKKTHFGKVAEVRHTDAFGYLKGTSKTFSMIFIAPPQYKNLWIEALQLISERPHLVSDKGLIIVQIDPKEYEPLFLEHFQEESQKVSGNSMFIFYRKL